MLLPRENKVVVTQHDKGIETLSEAQNAQLQREMDAGNRAGDTKEAATPVAPVTSGGSAGRGATAREKNGREWMRLAHVTRGASTRAEVAARQDEPVPLGEVVSAAFECEPTSY